MLELHKSEKKKFASFLKQEQKLWIFKRTFELNDITLDRSSRELLMNWGAWIDCMPRIQSMRKCNFHRLV